MDAESIQSALQAKNGVVMDFKLEWDAFRFLLFDKMFAMLGFNKQQEPILTLKLPPQDGAWYREEYAFITEGYYMNKVHWISVRYDLASRDLLMDLMEKSYANFLQRLTRKQQQQLASEDSIARHPDISY
ncbi:MAG: MmcQ/YjbR family DNA-binding protein [[Clostridium] innocuum]